MSKDFSSPTLSIIIPVFNMCNTLERCISFILNQSFKDFEAIFVDDCSTDTSSEIILKYCKLYPDKLIYTKTAYQGGPGHARNTGIDISRGKYIGFLDADDWIDSNLYSSVIQSAVKYNADIAIFGVKDEFDCRLSTKTRYEYKYFNCINSEFAIRALARTYSNDTYISPMVCQKVYKKIFIKKNKLHFKENTYFEDDLFSFQSFLCDSKIIIVPDVFYHYYQRPNSITHSFSKKHIDDLINFLMDLKKELLDGNIYDKYDSEYYALSQKCIINIVNLLFCSEQDVCIQKKYIIYLFKKLKKHFSIDEWINFLDINSIKRLFY